MIAKGSFKNSTVLTQFLVFVATIVIGYMFTSIITAVLLVFKFGLSEASILQVMQNLGSFPDIMRDLQFFQSIGMFIFPAIVCGWLFSDNYKNYLHIDAEIPLSVGILSALSMVVAVPFINFTADLNSQMVLPEAFRELEIWMRTMEDATAQVTEKMLYVHHWSDLVFNIIIVCILAAVGEELIFRGLLQNLFGKILKNPHVIIWIVAFVFSAIHFQFYGFLPRLLMGAYLGYLLYYTNNLWIPIIAHFTNNLVGVILFAIFQDTPEMSKQVDALGAGNTWWLAIISLVLFVCVFRTLKAQSPALAEENQ